MTSIEIGRRYRNKHTGIVCKVIGKIFFNIKYKDEKDPYNLGIKYCHYKRFRKNWEAV